MAALDADSCLAEQLQDRPQRVPFGVDSDRLYLPSESAQIPGAVPGAQLATVHSEFGHDGFLIEVDQLGAIVRGALAPLVPDGSDS